MKYVHITHIASYFMNAVWFQACRYGFLFELESISPRQLLSWIRMGHVPLLNFGCYKPVVPSYIVLLPHDYQERMMTSLLLRREEEERNRQNLPRVLEHSFPQVRSSTIYELTTQCYPRSQQDLNTPSLPGKF